MASIKEAIEFLEKYGQHSKDCATHFIDSSIDPTCNTFHKDCTCGFDQALAKLHSIKTSKSTKRTKMIRLNLNNWGQDLLKAEDRRIRTIVEWLKESLVIIDQLSQVPNTTEFTKERREYIESYYKDSGGCVLVEKEGKMYNSWFEAFDIIERLTDKYDRLDLFNVQTVLKLQKIEEENKLLREPLEAANFKVDGMLAVGQELIERDKKIKELRETLQDRSTEFYQTLDSIAQTTGIQIGRESWWDTRKGERIKLLLSKIKMLKQAPTK